MRFRKRGDIWHVRFTLDGTRHEYSTGCKDRRAAEARAKELERRAADPAGEARRAAEAITVQHAADLTLAHYDAEVRAGTRAPDTAEFYARKLGHVVRVLGETSVASIGATQVDAYIRQRRGEGASDHTVHKELGALKVMLGLAKRRGWWEGDLDTLTPEGWSAGYRPRDRALTAPELLALCRVLGPDRAAQVCYAVATSAELGALERAQRGDWREADGLVYVRGTKRETRDREVPVVLPACEDLLRFAVENAQGRGGDLFRPWGKNWRDLQQACQRAGIEPVTLNDLRRTFAHWHLAAGCAFEDVARAMGHVDTVMLQRVYGRLPASELRTRMARGFGANTAPPMPHARGNGGQPGHAGHDPRNDESPSGEGLSGCRRSELNQRPWDYDSRGLRLVIRCETRDARVSAGERRMGLAPPVPRGSAGTRKRGG